MLTWFSYLLITLYLYVYENIVALLKSVYYKLNRMSSRFMKLKEF